MTEPDTPDPSTPSGDPWWKPLAPDAPPPSSEGTDDTWWTPLATEAEEPDEPVEAELTEAEPVEPEPVEVAPEIEPPATVTAAHMASGEAGDLLLDDDPPSDRSRRTRAVVEWVAVIVGALLVALVVKTFLFQAFYIPSESMEPTLEKGDRVLVNKLSYDLHDVHRGDVIVFELDADEVGADGIKDLIKRAIGLPGDTIETRDGAVYIDDRKLDEPYLPKGTLTGDPSVGTNPEIPRQVVPEGTVFVLGDNRDNSADSRYASRGPIPIDHIVGRAFVLVWPPQDISGL